MQEGNVQPAFANLAHYSNDEILHYGTIMTSCCLMLDIIMTITKDRVKPFPLPDTYKLAESFLIGIVLGSYLEMIQNKLLSDRYKSRT